MANKTCYTYNAYRYVPLAYPQPLTGDAVPNISEVLLPEVRQGEQTLELRFLRRRWYHVLDQLHASVLGE